MVVRHNSWLNDELTTKVDSLVELRIRHSNLEEDMSVKLADVSMLIGVSLCCVFHCYMYLFIVSLCAGNLSALLG